MNDQRDEEEQEGRRPRVVDKRVSARGSDVAPTPEPPPPEPPASSPPSRTEDSVDAPPPPRAPSTPSRGDAPSGGEQQVWTPEQEAEMQRLTQEIAQRPSLEWVVNTALTLVNVAGTRPDAVRPPDLRGPRIVDELRYTGRTFEACLPLGPSVTSNSTAMPS
jgi:hypothetical protein